MIRSKILYLIIITIIIAIEFNAGAQSTEAIVAVNNSEINSKQIENEFLETKISNDVLESQVKLTENNYADIYLHRGIYVLTVLLSALIICIFIAIENGMFFLHKKEPENKARYEFEVFASDQ